MNATETTPQDAPKANLLEVIKTLFRWKKVIITACLIAAVGSAVIVLLLPVYYQSTTTFFAASPDQSTPELLFGESTVVPELYGNDNDIDRLLTICDSDDLIDFLVDSFQLYQHYDIDTTSIKAPFYVRRHFRGQYDIVKTKRDAIQLTIEDTDPQLATSLAMAARQKIDLLGQQVIKEGQAKAITTFKGNIKNKEQQLNILSDTLQGLRERYGIFNTEAQSESLTALSTATESRLISHRAKLLAFGAKGRRFIDSVQIYEVKVAGLEEELKQLNIKLSNFNEGLSQVLIHTRQYQEANSSLSEDKEKLKQYQATYDADISSILLVEEAKVPLIKSRPLRTIIVLASILVTLIFTVIGILLFEAYKHIDWKSIYQGQ